ncbi:class I tRNA ligase family protein [bacterium]|nr:MAG: class I tRNA ligase family protein [bacterium]
MVATKTDAATLSVAQAIEDYRFSEAGQTVYSLLWDDFADWYIEASKCPPTMTCSLLHSETILKLAHPIAPFVTGIWSEMPWHSHDLLITTAWPTVVDTTRTQTKLSERFETIKDLVQKTRTIAAKNNLQTYAHHHRQTTHRFHRTPHPLG